MNLDGRIDIPAGVAKLVEALALGASGRKAVEVRVLSPAPKNFIENFLVQ